MRGFVIARIINSLFNDSLCILVVLSYPIMRDISVDGVSQEKRMDISRSQHSHQRMAVRTTSDVETTTIEDHESKC